MSSTRNADDIIREMRQIRRELREDVAGIVDQAQVIADRAQDFTDWRFYVRNYPLVCLGAALAAGYFLVPARVKVIDTKGHEIKSLPPASSAKSPSIGSAIVASVGSLATGLLMQAVSTFARQHLNQFLEASLQGGYPNSSAPEAHSSNGKHSPAHSNGGHN